MFYQIFIKEKGNIKKTFEIYNLSKIIISQKLFDEDYYLKNYPDIVKLNLNPFIHYMYHGYKEGKNPSKDFDGNYYSKKYLDSNDKINPLIDYLSEGKEKGKFPNNDAEFNSLECVLKREKKLNADIKDLKLLHHKEIREINNKYQKRTDELKTELNNKHQKRTDELKTELNNKHQKRTDELKTELNNKYQKLDDEIKLQHEIDANVLSKNFDRDYYLKKYPDIRNANIDPLNHYITYGNKEGRFPNSEAEFNSLDSVLKREKKINADINDLKLKYPNEIGEINNKYQNRFNDFKIEVNDKYQKLNNKIKLQHEIDVKILSKNFDRNYYLEKYPDVKNVGIDPLNHYISYGNKEGRFPNSNAELNSLESVLKREQKLIHDIDNLNNINNKKYLFRDFSGYLSNSICSPTISAPFIKEEEKCFVMMDRIAKYLINKSSDSNEKPLVSIILATYNRLNILNNAIESALNQTYSNIELIIVDDGSDDGTSEFLKELNNDKITVKINESNKGVSTSRNIGISMAKGEYIAYLDSDNDWNSHYIETMMGGFIELPEADVLYCGQYLFNKKGEKPFGVRFGSFNKSLLVNGNYIDINCIIHKKSVLDEAGVFDENLGRYVDWDFIIRLSEKSKIFSVPVLLSNYYYKMAENRISHDTSLVYQLKNIITNREKRLRKFRKTDDNIFKNVSIIVYVENNNNQSYLHECLDSLFNLKLDKWIDITVVNNYSSQENKNFLKSLEKENKIKLIETNVNTYLSQIKNNGNDVLLIDSNTIITENAINLMQKYAYSLDKSGIIVPQKIVSQSKDIKKHVPYANSNNECDIVLSSFYKNVINVPTFHNGDYLELNYTPFFCFYIKEDVLQKINSFDLESFSLNKFDRSFCDYMLHLLNLKIFYITDAICYHSYSPAIPNYKYLKKTLKGDENYLFLINDSNNEIKQHYDFEYKNIFDSKLFEKSFNFKKSIFLKNKINYHYFIVPDKSLICGEFLPFKHFPVKRNYDKIKDLFPDFANILNVDHYFKVDSHINWKGSKLLSFNYLNTIDNDFKMADFENLIGSFGKKVIHKSNHDLLDEINWSYSDKEKSEYTLDSFETMNNTSVILEDVPINLRYNGKRENLYFKNPNSHSNLKALIFRDSSVGFFAHYLSFYFKEMFLCFDHGTLNKDVINWYKPNIIIEIRTERFLEGLPHPSWVTNELDIFKI